MRLAHVVLRTPQLEIMRDWYALVLGADVVYENAQGCFLTFDEEHHRIALICDPHATAIDRAQAGLDHIAFAFASLDELIGRFEQLAAADVHPIWEVDHGPTTSLYYRDPDDNRVELQIDNFDSPDETAAYFRSEAFNENPVGETIEFRNLVAHHRAAHPMPVDCLSWYWASTYSSAVGSSDGRTPPIN